MITRGEICAVVVTYHPDDQLHHNIAKLLANGVQAVLIVDNTPGQNSRPILAGLEQYPAVYVHYNGVNLGIAEALNQGADIAAWKGFSWIITFDQDTEVHSEFLEGLLTAYNDYPAPERAAVIGANYIEQNNGKCGETVKGGAKFAVVKDVITAGSLISIEILNRLGGFKSQYFIDMVDIEYCFRARQAGYEILITTTTLMTHSIGSLEPKSLLGFKFFVTNHSPLRRYYIFRNTIAMVKTYFWFDPVWSLSMLFDYLPKVLVKACIFEKKRTANFRWIVKGAVDGLLSRFSRQVL